MKKLIIGLVISFSFCFMVTTSSAQWPTSPYGISYGYRYQPRVYYQPRVVWIPQGSHLTIQAPCVSPNRRHVRFGINYGFYQIPSVRKFNFYTGRYE